MGQFNGNAIATRNSGGEPAVVNESAERRRFPFNFIEDAADDPESHIETMSYIAVSENYILDVHAMNALVALLVG